METKMWLVRAASLAIVGGLTVNASAQKPPKGAAPAADKPAAPPKPTTPEQEEEGPFAPKGRTGKMRDEAKPDEEKPAAREKAVMPLPEKPGAAWLDVVFGFGKAGGTTGPDAVEQSVVSFIAGARYRFDPNWSARIRVPFATGNIKHVGNLSAPFAFEPLNESYAASAFGNIELAAAYTLALGDSTKLPIELAITAPTASGDRFPTDDDPGRGRKYRINIAAAEGRGLEEDALFAPHRLGIIPKVSLDYAGGAIHTGAFAKTPVLIRAGGNDPPPAQPTQPGFKINSTVIEGVIGGDFHYAVYENKIDIGARAWATILSNDYYDVLLEGATAPSKFQFVLEPQVRGAFGQFRAAIGFIWPLGGRLGGDQQMNGLRLMGAYLF